MKTNGQQSRGERQPNGLAQERSMRQEAKEGRGGRASGKWLCLACAGLAGVFAAAPARASWPDATVINAGHDWPQPGATNWPANARLNGDAFWNSTYSSLWLVPDSASKAGSLVIDMPQSGQNAQAMYAEWRAKLQPGTSGGGDGYSFCYGDMAADALPTENGTGTLIVRYKTYGSDRIEVLYQGTVLHTYNLSWPFGSWTKNRVQVRGNGANYQVKVEWQNEDNGTWITILDWTVLAGWNPSSNWRFAFGARNGAAHQYVELRETRILTFPCPPIGAPTVTTGSANPVGATAATLNGTVNPNGSDTTARHQVLLNGSWTSGTSQNVGRGLRLGAGATDYVSFPAGNWFNYHFTVEAWVYLESYNYCRLVDFGNGANADNIVCELSDVNRGSAPVFWIFYGSSSDKVVSPVPLPLNRWTHVAFTFKVAGYSYNNVASIYINGTKVASANTYCPTPSPCTRSNNYLHKSNWSGQTPGAASFDDVRIWNAVLSQSTIDTWRNKEADSSHPNWSSLAAYWKFNESAGGEGAIAENSGPNNPTWDGTLHGSAAFANSAAPFEQPFSSTQASGLLPNSTYQFRIAAQNGSGNTTGSTQSFTTTLPGCDAIANVTMDEDTTKTVTVTGITDNDPFQTRTLSVTATSSNTGLLPNPTVAYTSPNSTATLTLAPRPNMNGVAVVTVTVSYVIGGTTYSTSRTFTDTVHAVNDAPVAGPAFALRFDGADDYVKANGVDLASKSFTVEAWARNTRPSTWQTFIWQGQPEQNKGLHIGWRANNVFTFAFHNNDLNTTAAYPDQDWHHWACSYDAASKERRIYRDGVLVAQDTSSADYQGTGEFKLGAYHNKYFQGDLDEVRVWTTVRTESEVRRNMTEPLRGDETGLLAYWRFDEGSAVTAHDSNSSPSAQDGTFAGAPAWFQGEVPYGWTVNENTAEVPSSKEIFLPGFDVDSSSLTYTIVSNPSHGTLSGSGSVRTYTPALNYNGADSFTYRVSDGSLNSATVTVNIIVTEVNSPPGISAIANQLIEEDTDTGQIAFTVSDVETAAGDLQVSARLLDTTVVAFRSLELGGADANRWIKLTPEQGEIGAVTVVLTVFDGTDTTSTDFELEVVPRPAYALVDVGTLTGWNRSWGMGLNDDGELVGYCKNDLAPDTAARAFLCYGLERNMQLADLGLLAGGKSSKAYGVNSSRQVTGEASDSNGKARAFLHDGDTLRDLGVMVGGTWSIGYAINDNGLIAGAGNCSASSKRPFVYGGSFTNLGVFTGGTYGEALALNSHGEVVGWADDASGQKAFRYRDGQLIKVVVPGAPADSPASARGINDDGTIAGRACYSGGVERRAFVSTSAGQTTDLGRMPPNNAETYANGINAFGQVVGYAYSSGYIPFLYSAGKYHNLNDLIPEDTGWQLREAHAINRDGFIAGTGMLNGKERAFLGVPAWTIGRPIARPQGTVAQMPTIDILSGDGRPDNSFFWSLPEKRLYAVRPVTAKLSWFMSKDPADTNRVVTVGISIWPRQPTIHVAQTPVEIEPKGAPFDYSYQTILYQTADGVRVDASSRQFSATQPGYAVLLYLKTMGYPANPEVHKPFLDVVRTVTWDNSKHLTEGVQWYVGDPITNADHTDYLGKNGYLFFENATYDGTGPNRAYDRGTRLGPIIPVNIDSQAQDDDMVVVWYKTNQIGVAWSSLPCRYRLEWPEATAPKLIIASSLGSGPLDSLLYPEKQVYNQPDRNLPGYNPNEEHALIAPSSTGEALYALRCDLNAVIGASQPYALLKYKDPATKQWRIKVYRVLAEEAPYFFRYAGEAGKEIQPPMPLCVLPLCPESAGVNGPYWEDWKGKLYARAAGPEGLTTNVVLRWFYPLQPGFFHDLNLDGTNDVPVSSSLAWLDRLPGGQVGRPVDVTYNIRWPDDVPVLQVGETLLTAKHGLPGVKNMARAQAIFDELDPNDNDPSVALARLYDPLSVRTVKLGAGFKLPDDIRHQNASGKEIFVDLPYALRVRLSYDPINRWLSWAGFLDESGVGEPLLLPNVMTARERDRIKAATADPNATAWRQAVDDLYALSRNPNRVDLDPQDGGADQDLRLGLSTLYITNVTTETEYQVTLRVVTESLADLPKALTAALADTPPAEPRPRTALEFAGQGAAQAQQLTWLEDFTISIWAKIDPANTGCLFASGSLSSAGLVLKPEPGANRFVLSDRPDTSYDLEIQPYVFDTDWHHVALVRSLADAELRLYMDGKLIGISPARGLNDVSGLKIADGFQGQVDEFQIWSRACAFREIRNSMSKQLNGAEDGLICYWRFDEGAGAVAADATANGFDGAISGATWVESNAPAAVPPRYVTLAENNAPSLGGLPVSLKIIQVDDGPYRGDLKILYPDNVFDERLTLRHSSDFGGAVDSVEFEWYYKSDSAGFDPTDMPVVGEDGSITDMRGWIRYSEAGPGVNDITIGDGAQAGVLTLGDNWFICRYRGFPDRDKVARKWSAGEYPGWPKTPTSEFLQEYASWSEWIGDPASISTPRAALAEGWIKRVIRGLNPFDARTKDFHASEVNTYASMLIQAGPRYEGDIAFNPSADSINSIGLIEAYQTVLNRGKGLSIDGVPAVDFDPANNALLLAASRVSDLYVLLGNEAYADAQDPTIGFSTTGQAGTSLSVYGSLATSVFAFQNQMDSLLEEELVLLRGRDESAAGVQGAPVYNRLLWNFTLGDGEVAYQQTYNISDQNKDGSIDEKDARILHPQGHGDAWGHYLTATTTYYDLLRHPNFTWTPRAESVLVAGTAVQVDFLDERKFARAAAAKAKVGKEIVDLTYRLNYVDDPAGQWQGYEDTRQDRAWGVTECARRAGQGAYFDWVTANAILPASDPNPDHTGLQKIDRTTVGELAEIPPEYDEIQRRMDEADAGMNPFGLAKGAVPFDIDPAQVSAGKTHFEQVQERALKAMNNTVTVWNEANQANELLRRNQDSVEKFTQANADQERDYKNRLIETFGYPYAGDIGPGKTFPSGYDGPDLYHWMYVNTVELNQVTAPPSSTFTGFFESFHYGVNVEDESRYGAIGGQGDHGADYFYFPEDLADYWRGEQGDVNVLEVQYPVAAGDFAFAAPDAWGQRRAPGELQVAIGELVKGQARFRQAQLNYDNLIKKMEDAVYLLQARYDLREDQLHIYHKLTGEKIGIGAAIAACKITERACSGISQRLTRTSEVLIEAIPKVVGLSSDAFSGCRSGLKGLLYAGTSALDATAVAAEVGSEALQTGLLMAEGVAQAELRTVAFEYEVKQQVAALEELFRQEAVLRVEMFTQKQVLEQAYGKVQSTLAKGQRLLDERLAYRKRAAAQTTEARYQDMTFRVFRNDALQKYRASFDLAARYVFLAATAYDYEVNLLGTDSRGGQEFLTDIVRQRSLGQMVNGQPVVGQSGLADALGRLGQNFEVLKTQLGFNNPQAETGRFSLRNELLRLKNSSSDEWKAELQRRRVADLWALPEFRAYCRPFAPESAGAQPGLVIRFASTINYGQNFFGWPLSGGDSAYDPSTFATKIHSVGVWFSSYDGNGLSQTPRVYLVPAGLDMLRSPTGNSLATRQWRVVDQALPVPFAIGKSSLRKPDWIPVNDSLGGSFVEIRRFASFRAYHDSGFQETQMTSNSRLIGRSVWNTDWLLIIPGGTLLANADTGLDSFINSVSDIRLFFETYSYAGY